MKGNVLIFHGTGGYPEENWFPWLKSELEKEGIKVFVPQFPNPDKPRLSEWLNTLKEYKQYINEETILVGHSLGGIFLLRVLERLEKSIKAAFFVASSVGVKPLLNYEGDYNPVPVLLESLPASLIGVPLFKLSPLNSHPAIN